MSTIEWVWTIGSIASIISVLESAGIIVLTSRFKRLIKNGRGNGKRQEDG